MLTVYIFYTKKNCDLCDECCVGCTKVLCIRVYIRIVYNIYVLKAVGNLLNTLVSVLLSLVLNNLPT